MALPEPLQPLSTLVMNLRWSWHVASRDLFESMDPQVWAAVNGDPVKLLGAVSPARLAELAADEGFLARLAEAHADLENYLSSDRWYQSLGPEAPKAIGYFSPEFGITEVLPQYSGGLGILAGDHLKAASDIGVPIIGVGLLYQHGYFSQSLSADGWQLERYPPIDPYGLPLELLRAADGSPLRVEVGFPGDRTLRAQVWKAQVGRVPLLLLDSDVEDNGPSEREVTDRLYGGSTEHRLQQEMLLGIGGVRAIRAYCALTGAPEPEVFHTNEGHAGFLGVERIRELAVDEKMSFDESLAAVRAGTVFTTHTPVPAGIDRFPRELIASYFGPGTEWSSLPVDRILALGAEPAGGDPQVYNMAYMGLRLGQRANGVSILHGEVSRGMFAGLWPGFEESDVPIASVTNGVHAPTWVSREMQELLGREIGVSMDDDEEGWTRIDAVDGGQIWKTRADLRTNLVTQIRSRLRQSSIQRGATEAELGWIATAFDPEILTIGFARRVPSYKRLTLMLRDRERLTAMLLDKDRPIQIVIAGKAHPADDGGKALVQQIVKFTDDPKVRHRIAFLPDYDIGMARDMMPGVDVWLNNPLRPLEACGTSGMKVALNGGLNLSIRDGWWDEMFDGANGWAIPSADGVEDQDRRDELEANALYDLIENNVRARFYDRDGSGLPPRWLEMVRHNLKSLGPQVLASRMVRDYVNQLYTPAAGSSRVMLADTFAAAKELASWKAMLLGKWSSVRVGHVETIGESDSPEVGNTLSVRASIDLGGLSATDVAVEVVYGRADDYDVLHDISAVTLSPDGTGEDGLHRYTGALPLGRTGSFGYSVRVLPSHPSLVNPAELGLVVNA
ncbi:glycosyltransferase family 1 protein [Acidothermaceae bacterium B102]|nr:glycosyltransferase family 1 protein [Acidothermaceae bacterium B102]